MIPILSKPYPDEYWYGYISRMALLNGFKSVREFEELCILLRDSHRCIRMISDLTRICDRFKGAVFPDVKRAVEMTTYYDGIDRETPAEQAFLSEHILFDLGHGTGAESKSIRYCPECIKADREKYGESYIHVTHQLRGVQVCPVHRCRLKKLAVDIYDRNMKPAKEQEPEEDIGRLAGEAEEAVQSFYRNMHSGILKKYVCPVCGRRYLAHPVSAHTGLPCPFCSGRMSLSELLRSRLQYLYGGEYVLCRDGGENLGKYRAKHILCGSVKKDVRKLIWEYPVTACSECRKMTAKKLQARINHTRNDISVLEVNRKEGKVMSAEIEHIPCGRHFRVFKGELPEWTCPYCSGREFDIHDLSEGYDIISPLRNNHQGVMFRHNGCGCVFITSKTSFINGSRCPVCSPRYSYGEIEDMVKECAGEYTVKQHIARGKVMLYYRGFLLGVYDYRAVAADLESANPRIIIHRNRQFQPPVTKKRIIYQTIRDKAEESGSWGFSDGIPGVEMTRITRNMIRKMTVAGLLVRTERGRYKVNVPDDSNYGKNYRR
ncbi:MAG: TniQ family protein [Lachnospiraceae bacterium]|nr:TniQ family protein [Lachnospiraceae bacterium]MBQ6364434.1 TniQ family protein [Lachnospiraceae bacterium]